VVGGTRCGWYARFDGVESMGSFPRKSVLVLSSELSRVERRENGKPMY
jgi:hypothetical protein